MKKPTLIPALTIAAVAMAALSLPATASADSSWREARTVVRGDHQRDANVRPVHNMERRHSDSRHSGHSRGAPPRYQHDRGHHYGHRQQHARRYEYRPVERHVFHYDDRPLVRYEPRYDDNVRVRISYDLHL